MAAHKILKSLALLGILALAAGCSRENAGEPGIVQSALLKPGAAFSAENAPPAPDYNDPAAWAALPGRADSADQAPEGGADAQDAARADVFFIHPTTYFSKDGWNAPYTDGGEGAMGVERGTMRAQAGAFNRCCRVFAPRYRQATLYTFMAYDENSKAALDLAYRDVARAFDNFISIRNDGRPFIIASHSQGSYHAMRLIEEKLAGSPLMDRLVAVYAIGGPLPTGYAEDVLPACAAAAQTGCMIGWNTVSETAGPDPRRTERALIWLDGDYQPIAGRPLLCVNPLNWSVNGAADAASNLGSLPGKQPPDSLSATVPGIAAATCRNGFLVVYFPTGSTVFDSRFTKDGSYHIFDYNLFYDSIRANAQTRVDAFLAR